ncbi:MAG: glycerophosphodiester phosphodiesterase family protein [Pirellulaceae bacterium]
MAQSSKLRPIVIAHRGASGYLPEHTLPAKALAFGQHADFLEQDVVITKDDRPIVLHDIHLDTVTDVATRFPDRKRSDGRFYAIDFTLAEIQSLSVHERIDLKTEMRSFRASIPRHTHFCYAFRLWAKKSNSSRD